jgi:hypothetical protein
MIRVTIDSDERNSARVVEAMTALADAEVTVEIRDARTDEAAAAFLDRLVCCGSVTPVVESGGLLLTAPTPAEALLAVRRALPAVVG